MQRLDLFNKLDLVVHKKISDIVCSFLENVLNMVCGTYMCVLAFNLYLGDHQ